MGIAADIARASLAAVFVVAGVAKLLDLPGTRSTMLAFGVPRRLARRAGTALPFAELATAVALVPTSSARWGGVAALVLLIAFISGIARVLAQGQAPDCNCFGQIASAPVSWRTLARNGVLAALATLVVVRGPGTSLLAWAGSRSAADVIAIFAVLVVLAAAMVALQMRRENRSLHQTLFRLRREVGLLPSGLPVGMRAPGFELSDVDGKTITLATLIARRRPVALVFLAPDCGPCVRLLPELVRWRAALADRITFVVFSFGSPEDPQVLADLRESGDVVALIEEGEGVGDHYRVRSTPSTVIVRADGRVASGLAGGPDEIEALVRLTVRGTGETDLAQTDLVGEAA